MKKITGIATLRVFAEEFEVWGLLIGFICKLWIILDLVFIILLVLRFMVVKLNIGEVLNYCEIWGPIIICNSIQ
jgi:hypothetical protein